MSARIADVAARLARSFPPEWAESWDRVGLLAGDATREVTGVSLALDPTRAAISTATATGANLLVTHHPAFLEPPSAIAPGMGPGGVIFAALDAGVALLNAHTNLDRAPAAGRILPERLGLDPIGPIERSAMPMTLITVFVPRTQAEPIADAMALAGAGRLGEYERAYFAAEGRGAFTPSASATPFDGTPGVPSAADETRIEMVAPRGRTSAVLAAARGAHPYEEPLIVASDVTIVRTNARMGMLSQAAPGTTLSQLAQAAAAAFGVTPRVWGDPSATLDTVATATGSAGSLVPEVLASGARALVAGEVRYHDALEAVQMGLSIVELGHDVSEWPLVDLLAEAVSTTPGLDPSLVRVQPAIFGWWTPGKDR